MRMRPEDFTQFRKSKPWGYYPPAVEEKIAQYEETIRNMSEKFLEQRQLNLNLKQKVEQLQDELREMHLQMSSLELPEAVEAVEHFVLDDFKNYNSGNHDDIEEPIIVGDENEYKESEENFTYGENQINDENGDDDEDTPFIIVK